MDSKENCRKVEVPGEGEFDVPKYVSRVDSGDEGKRGWHGWQVRWPKFSRFFTDQKYGGCASALEVASEFVRENYPGKKSQVKSDAGISLAKTTHRKSGTIEYHIVILHPKRGVAPRRLYVGTEATFSAEKYKQLMKEARVLRAKFVADHKANTGTI